MTAVLVVVGAMIGAPLRYLIDRVIQTRTGMLFPWGTLTVNVAGSLLLGGLVGAAVSGPALALIGTGLCGALTTYSTFGYETLRLVEDRAYPRAAANAVVSLVTTLGAAALGHVVANALVG